MSGLIAYRYLVDPFETREALSGFMSQSVIGLDTETYYDYERKQYLLSLLQLASPSGEVIIVDAFGAAIEEARPLIQDPAIVMAAHNARYDEGALREAGFEPAGFVDTLKLARRTLSLESFNLAAVAAHLCGLELDKSFQKSDWRRRPLSREQLDYAALDAWIALRVYEELRFQLGSRWEEECASARLDRPQGEGEAGSQCAPRARERRPSVLLRPLTPDEVRIVERLRNWRRETARKAGIPAYLICPDKTLEHLAIARPQSSRELSSIYGLGPAKIARFGEAILEQLK